MAEEYSEILLLCLCLIRDVAGGVHRLAISWLGYHSQQKVSCLPFYPLPLCNEHELALEKKMKPYFTTACQQLACALTETGYYWLDGSRRSFYLLVFQKVSCKIGGILLKLSEAKSSLPGIAPLSLPCFWAVVGQPSSLSLFISPGIFRPLIGIPYSSSSSVSF